MITSVYTDATGRVRHLGASELAAALGMGKYDKPLDLFNYKTGRTGRKPQTEPMLKGIRLEPIACDYYIEEICTADEQVVRQPGWTEHPSAPLWFGCKPDAIVTKNGVVVRAAEFKVTSTDRYIYKYDDPTEWLKAEYKDWFWQGHATANILKVPCDLFMLIDGDRIFHTQPPVTFYPDPAVDAYILENAAKFWQYVVDDKPPVGIQTKDFEVLENYDETMWVGPESPLGKAVLRAIEAKKQAEEARDEAIARASKAEAKKITVRSGVLATIARAQNKPTRKLDKKLLKARLPADFDLDSCYNLSEPEDPWKWTLQEKIPKKAQITL